MVFSIQRFLEDYFNRRGLTDGDQYAISLANAYDRARGNLKSDDFLRSLRRIRTAFYSINSHVDKDEFLRTLLPVLDRKFKKKENS